MKTKILFSMFALAFALMTSCAKKGDTGPAGPAGKDGNANVISTNTLQLNSWTFNSTTNTYSTSVSAPGITQAVRDNGVVMVYLQNGTTWIPLPNNDGTVEFTFDFYTGGIDLEWYNDNGSVPINPSGITIRVVIIPASMKGHYSGPGSAGQL